MRIARVDVFRYELPLARPLVLRTCICTSRSGLLLRFEDGDGAFAFGEAAPLPGFSGQTAMQLVRGGRADDVLDYVDAVDAGVHA